MSFHIKEYTEKDPVLSKVKRLIQCDGEIPETEAELSPYSQKASELSVVDGTLHWGSQVVIPHPGCAIILQLLETHSGESKMKNLARSYIWWSGLDKDIENTAAHCNTCQIHQSAPAQALIHPWEYPKRLWARVHLDQLVQ